MEPTRQQLADLAASLPPLDTGADTLAGRALPGLADYLDYYGINFARELPHIRHSCGVLSCDSFRIVAHYWAGPQPKGTLVIVHGYYDHVGIYGNAIRFGLEQGLAVLAFDLPGHGLSSGEQASIGSFNQYGDVLASLLQQTGEALPQPIHALGQSTGGSVLLNYLWRYPDRHLDRVALFSPLVIPVGWRTGGRWLHFLLRWFVSSIRRKFVQSSHDQRFTDFLAQRDPLQARRLPVAWVDAMKKWDRATRDYPPLNKSLLVVQGTDDDTVAWRYNLKRLQDKLPNGQFQLIDGAKHQLVNETEAYRQPAFAMLRQWLETRPENPAMVSGQRVRF